ncbi:MAG: AzlD domain-containing protein [Nocardioidaceae bacterium]
MLVPMTPSWMVIALLAVGTFVIKAAGPVLLGRRPLPRWLARSIALLLPALLAALILEQTLAHGQALRVDARAVGVVVALGALALRLSIFWVLVLAAGSTALVRLLL